MPRKKKAPLNAEQRKAIIELLGPMGFSWLEMAKACECSLSTIRKTLIRMGGGARDLWPERPRDPEGRYAAAFVLYQRYLREEIMLRDSVVEVVCERIELDKIRSFMDGMVSAYQAMTNPIMMQDAGIPWQRLYRAICGRRTHMSDDRWLKERLGEIEGAKTIDDITAHLARRMSSGDAAWDRDDLQHNLPADFDLETFLRDGVSLVLSERMKEVIVKRYGLSGEGYKSLTDLGREFGLSRERVRQCEREALQRLREQLDWPRLSIRQLREKLEAEQVAKKGLQDRLHHVRQALEGKPTVSREHLMRSSSVLQRYVDTLELSVRSQVCLHNAGIEHIHQLVQKTEEEMLKTKNFGRRSLREIRELLSELGLRLGMTEADINSFVLGEGR